MRCPTTATAFCSSLTGLLLLSVCGVGCRPAVTPPPSPVFVYCTPAAEAHAKILRCVFEASSNRPVRIAPMTCDSLLAALDGTRAGDAVVFAGDELGAALASRGLLRGEPLTFPQAVCAVGLAPFELADLALPGKRLGGCAPERPLGAAVRAALPDDLRPRIEANISHRSERGDELVRLLRLGALDAAFLWATPPPPAVLHVLRLAETDTAAASITVAGLSCSRLSDAEWAQVMAVWRSETTHRALAGEPVPTVRTAP